MVNELLVSTLPNKIMPKYLKGAKLMLWVIFGIEINSLCNTWVNKHCNNQA